MHGMSNMMMNQMPNQNVMFNNPNKNMMNQQKKTEINDKYKTERCRHYETHKNCALGDKCHFAHGDEELRKPEDPLNPEQMNVAHKYQQYLNCNQDNA